MTEADKLIEQLRDALKRCADVFEGQLQHSGNVYVQELRDLAAAADAYLARPRGEPVAWMHATRSNADVITDGVKRFLAQVSPYKVENYTIPLYAAPAAPEWVSVEERLPVVPKGVRFIVVATLCGGIVLVRDWWPDSEFGTNVTHWMPLPSPPADTKKD